MEHTKTFEELLRSLHFRVTPGRIKILEVLTKEQKPITVVRLFELMGKSLDTVTLYRALEAFAEKGIVRRVDLGHSHAHYELAVTRKHHHHLVCTNCERVEDVMSCPPAAIEKEILAESKYFKNINTHALEFFGLCKTCV